MSAFFYDEPSHRGYCRAHSRRGCRRCRDAEAASVEYGVFVWRADARYMRKDALTIEPTRAKAERYIEEREGNLVVRTLDKANA